LRPKRGWADADYAAAAAKRIERWRRLLARLARDGLDIDGARMLEVGCGSGLYSLLMATEPVRYAIGLDVEPPLFLAGERGDRHRRLLSAILRQRGIEDDLWTAISRLPVSIVTGDSTHLFFADDSLDLIFSSSALEHIQPIEQALAEMTRVLRPGGAMRHDIHPFFSLRGCHKDGVVDMPWAHARLEPAEFHQFVDACEGPEAAVRRSGQIESLNRITLDRWRAAFEVSGLEVVSWEVRHSPASEELLDRHGDVLATLLPGVERRDLVHDRIAVTARKR